MESPEIEVAISSSEEETHRIAQEFAKTLQPGDIVTLEGELGSGKTEFVRGLCTYFDVEDIVTSPTFSIVNVYHGRMGNGRRVRVVHIDLYRLKSKEEIGSIGLHEWLNLGNSIIVIEWPERVNSSFERDHFRVNIQMIGTTDSRKICIKKISQCHFHST